MMLQSLIHFVKLRQAVLYLHHFLHIFTISYCDDAPTAVECSFLNLPCHKGMKWACNKITNSASVPTDAFEECSAAICGLLPW